MRGLSLDQLRTFADVVELGSFSAAAARLSLSQPAVSLQVRELERRLGVRLIDRVGRRATPTPAGADLLAHAQRIDAAVAAALEAVAAHAAGTVGRVRLGTGATACIYLLPTALRRLRRDFPDIEVVVSTGNTADVMRQLEENALDVAFATLPVGGRALDVTPVVEDEFVAIFPADGAAPPPRVTPAALAGWPVVLYEPGANTRRAVDDWFARGGQTLKPAMQLGSVEAIKELVGAGLGCGVVPAMAVRDDDRSRQLTVRPLTPRLSRRLALALRRDKPLTRPLREVVRAIAALGEREGAPG